MINKPVQTTKQDQRKCPACGQKGYDCQIWDDENLIRCEHEGRFRIMTEDEILFIKDEKGWSTTDGWDCT